MWNKQRYSWQLQSHVWITNLREGNSKTSIHSENFRISSLTFDMEGHAKKCVERYCELANRTTQKLYIKEEELKSVGELSQVCSQIVLKCLYLHELVDLIFYGQWTNLHDRSRNGPELVTNDWISWYLTFITHVNTNSIVMWVILQSNADWDCFKTPILREILRTQNLLQVEHCAFWEVIRLFQSVGCVRNKLQFRTVQQNQKSSKEMQDWG